VSDAVLKRAASNPLMAMAWMAGALASFSTVAVAGREAGAALMLAAGRDAPAFADTVQIMFYRSAIGLVLVTIAIATSSLGFRAINLRRWPLHAGRNLIHFAAQFSWFHALTLIPLATLFALEFTAPLWVAVFAWLLLGERFTWSRLAAVGLGFCGIITIVPPGVTPIALGSTLALSAAVGFALSMIATKRLTTKDNALAILFHMSWMQLICAAGFAVPVMTVPTLAVVAWVTIVGVCGLSAHFCLARAFAEADAMIVAPMDFLRLPLIMTVGALAYGEPLSPVILAGAALVLLANALNLWGQHRTH